MRTYSLEFRLFGIVGLAAGLDVGIVVFEDVGHVEVGGAVGALGDDVADCGAVVLVEVDLLIFFSIAMTTLFSLHKWHSSISVSVLYRKTKFRYFANPRKFGQWNN